LVFIEKRNFYLTFGLILVLNRPRGQKEFAELKTSPYFGDAFAPSSRAFFVLKSFAHLASSR
jgi:hypothetical protein